MAPAARSVPSAAAVALVGVGLACAGWLTTANSSGGHQRSASARVVTATVAEPTTADITTLAPAAPSPPSPPSPKPVPAKRATAAPAVASRAPAAPTAQGAPRAQAAPVPQRASTITAAAAAASAAPVAAGGGDVHAASYTFSRTNADGSPVRFNPCDPIHVVLNLAEAPPDALSTLTTAINAVAAATGLMFVIDGNTTEVPQSSRPAVQARYGSGWVPVLIAWSRHGESDLLPGGSALGQGQATWFGTSIGTDAFVTGQLVIDADATARLAHGFGAGQTMGELLLHELAHLVGLGHTQDITQVMYPLLEPLPAAAFGSGDLAGLRLLGAAGGCFATPAPA